MAKGKRKTIILNPDNPKEKLILELLEQQYNASEFIKDLLFNYTQNLNNNNLHDDNIMTNILSHNGNCIATPLSLNDNIITTQLSRNDDPKFIIDLNNVSDADANISESDTEENPTKNALDFLKSF